eukprot:3104114-Rhodomonas_salina.1
MRASAVSVSQPSPPPAAALVAFCGCMATTPLEAGTRFGKEDSPEFVDPALHCRYRGITGHLSFLVTMTRCDLAFAYAELS